MFPKKMTTYTCTNEIPWDLVLFKKSYLYYRISRSIKKKKKNNREIRICYPCTECYKLIDSLSYSPKLIEEYGDCLCSLSETSSFVD